MFANVPAQYWLLILIALWMVSPADYAVRYVAGKPSAELARRSRGRFLISIAMIVVLVGLARFIFTARAAELAYSILFKPVMITALTAFAGGTVVRDLMRGHTDLIGGSFGPYARADQPRRFWVAAATSMAVTVLAAYLAWMAWTGRI